MHPSQTESLASCAHSDELSRSSSRQLCKCGNDVESRQSLGKHLESLSREQTDLGIIQDALAVNNAAC